MNKGISKDKKTGRFILSLKDIKCLFCTKEFHPRFKIRKYCSKKCEGLYRTKSKSKECIVCKITFCSKSPNTRYCSQKCYGSTLIKPKKEKTIYLKKRVQIFCKTCNIIFSVVPARKDTAKFCSRTCFAKYRFSGERHPKYIKDRTKLKMSDSIKNDPRRKEWTRNVKNRDKWTCRIADVNCNGQLEAHHIFRWIDFPELRYEINNGITLCHAHHPLVRAEEKRLIPTFREIILQKCIQ